MKKLLKWIGIVLAGLVGLAVLAALALTPGGMNQLTHTYPGAPVAELALPSGPEAIALGRHVAVIWACTKCHGADLSGTLLAQDDPFIGTVPAGNLTPGPGGIGATYTTADWVRAIRQGIKPDGHAEIMMYNYTTLSDRDLGALIAYLKQLPPVTANLPALRIGPALPVGAGLGLVTLAAEHSDPRAPRPAAPTPEASAAYGSYLAAPCYECHSTSLAKKLEKWSPSDFQRAMHSGTLPSGKQLGAAMPLPTYAELSDTEITALWLYFTNLRQQGTARP